MSDFTRTEVQCPKEILGSFFLCFLCQSARWAKGNTCNTCNAVPVPPSSLAPVPRLLNFGAVSAEAPPPLVDPATSLHLSWGKHMGVSGNRATPIAGWFIYNAKSYSKGWYGGTPISGKPHMEALWTFNFARMSDHSATTQGSTSPTSQYRTNCHRVDIQNGLSSFLWWHYFDAKTKQNVPPPCNLKQGPMTQGGTLKIALSRVNMSFSSQHT